MGTTGKSLRHKQTPWWTSSLTTQRKEVNAKRRRYQRTKVNSEIRGQHKEQYLAAKVEYSAAIRREKSKSWKEFCNLTPATNPWNEIYKMMAGKTKQAAQITTLKLKDGTLTTNIQDTLLHMIQKFAPEDNQEEDAETHSQIRKMVNEAPDTQDDEEFTLQEVSNTIQSMVNQKAPGADGITNEVWKCIGAILPRYLTAIYNGCLRERNFSEKVEESKVNTHGQTGQKGSDEVSTAP